MREHDIISHYFTRAKSQRANRLSIGDDAAIIRVPSGHELVVSIDTLVEGVHFFKSAEPYALGHKTLAVSLSDIAAMGAKPISALLSLTHPKVDQKWLKQFQAGFFNLAKEYHVDLIGGDTCQGPLSLSSVVHGIIPLQQSILRSGAKVSDLIFVSGCLGDAGYALQALKKNQKISPYCLERLHQPSPRVKLGEYLRPFASAMIDVSDGLIIDLKRILSASFVGATLYSHHIPLSPQLSENNTINEALKFALGSGDDYELCFTVPEKLAHRLTRPPTPITCIGKIEKKSGLIIRDAKNKIIKFKKEGYEHF
jgi:thiamine-monophosphate kinase